MRHILICSFLLVFLVGILFTRVPGSIAEEISQTESYSIATPEYPTGEMYVGPVLSVSVPAGWHAEPGYAENHLILLYGDGRYLYTASVMIAYLRSDFILLRDPAAGAELGYRDINVSIDGQNVIAWERTKTPRGDSAPVYWTTDYICLPVDDAFCIWIEATIDSSEFQCFSLDDAAIQEIVTSVRLS